LRSPSESTGSRGVGDVQACPTVGAVYSSILIENRVYFDENAES
jgi:hypothetical protein